MNPKLLLLIPALAMLTACGEPEDTRPGQPVKTRQSAFKEILRSFEPMGIMLRTNKYDADRFAKLAADLVAKRDAPWSHFGPDTDYPPTKATHEVWQRPEEFERDRKAFIDATDALLAAVQSGDKARIETTYKATYQTCQDCHHVFKAR